MLFIRGGGRTDWVAWTCGQPLPPTITEVPVTIIQAEGSERDILLDALRQTNGTLPLSRT